MDISSLMWVSVERFHELMKWPVDDVKKACKSGGIICENVYGNKRKEYRISVLSLSIFALKKHISAVMQEETQQNIDLLEARKNMNAIAYTNMKPFEQKSVDKWLPIINETKGLKGRGLKRILKRHKISYPTFMRHRKRWEESGGDISSLKVNYHNR